MGIISSSKFEIFGRPLHSFWVRKSFVLSHLLLLVDFTDLQVAYGFFLRIRCFRRVCADVLSLWFLFPRSVFFLVPFFSCFFISFLLFSCEDGDTDFIAFRF